MNKIFSLAGYLFMVVLPCLFWVALCGWIIYLSWFMYLNTGHGYEEAMIAGMLGLFGYLSMYYVALSIVSRRHWAYPNWMWLVDGLVVISRILLKMNGIVFGILIFLEIIIE